MTRYLVLSRKRCLLLTSLLLGLLLIGPGQRAALVLAQDPQTTAFVQVNVIPMESETVLANQTVLVEGDHITAIGPADAVTVLADRRAFCQLAGKARLSTSCWAALLLCADQSAA